MVIITIVAVAIIKVVVDAVVVIVVSRGLLVSKYVIHRVSGSSSSSSGHSCIFRKEMSSCPKEGEWVASSVTRELFINILLAVVLAPAPASPNIDSSLPLIILRLWI